ncbi:type II secretion system protein [Neobacillus sp. PS3-34]|uniref:type II secretion system protein n=1 Tax=Neobacillus sp. PS3-34 TaxID=3070678 RepID=UPI0027E18187|nr:type II secretion system protein [Neobacillus sp. PS3-34]WML47375.1 type II secretion system protein [Neobacillus sp. PS3-34]
MVNRLKMKLKEQKGFTLIELLAVIVILGIIAAIAIPAIGNVISKSNDKATVQEGLQIISAAKMYVANNNVTTAQTLSKTQLDPFLDHVKSNTFSVILTVDSVSGKITYALGGSHPAIPIANTTTGATSATEQQLTDATH